MRKSHSLSATREIRVLQADDYIFLCEENMAFFPLRNLSRLVLNSVCQLVVHIKPSRCLLVVAAAILTTYVVGKRGKEMSFQDTKN